MGNKKKRNKTESKSGEESTDVPTNPEIPLVPLGNPGEDGVEAVEINEQDEAMCIHVRKYQQPTSANKRGHQKMSNIKSLKCLACVTALAVSNEDTINRSENEELWFCMHCFETRCGRYDNEHSLKHYESDTSHCLMLCVSNFKIWCYKCDRFIAPELVRGKLESSLNLAKKGFKSKKPDVSFRDLSQLCSPIEDTSTSNFRVIGLNNLGNTCYFNSALQNLLYLSTFRRELSYTLGRTEFTLVPKKHADLEPITFSYISNDATAPGDLTNALSLLIQQTKIAKDPDLSIGKKSHSKRRVTSPKEVQQAIAKKHRKFSNGSQQDSHELLRFLIDMIKDEEIKRLKVAFLNHFEATGHKTEFKNYPEEKKKLLKKYVSEFKNIFVFTGTFIDYVFGGEILSIVRCHSCMAIFSVNEAFLDISLPLPIEKHSSNTRNPQTKKGEKQLKKSESKLSKNEKKRLLKQNSKTMSLQAFNNTSNTLDEHQMTCEPNKDKSKHKENSKIEGEKVDTTDGDSREESRDSREHEKHLSNEMNGLNIDHSLDDKPFKEELPNANAKDNEEISDNTSHSKEDNEEISDSTSHAYGDIGESTRDISDNITDNVVLDSNNINAIEPNYTQPITPEDSHTNTQQEMEIEHSSPEITEPTDTQSMTDITGDEVKSKEITRLRIPTPPAQDTLEHFITRFFSPEILYGDYLCTYCNPQLSNEDDKESSQESIDLSKCKFSDATKQFHVKTLPPILTIHLKRFSQIGLRLQKIGKQIYFPLILDMSPYCINDTPVARDSDDLVLYGLRGIVNHSGGMLAGHYIAYVNIADWSSQLPQNDRIETQQTTDTTEDLNNSEECPMDVCTESAEASKPTLTATNPSTHMYNPYEFSTHVQPTEDWYYISDSSVTKVTSDEVFKTQAYILFYERLPIIPK